MACAQRFVGSVPASAAVKHGAAPGAIRPLRPSDPRSVGGYVLTGRLGSGGEATVYRAESRRTGSVAVKVLRRDGATARDDGSCMREYTIARRIDPHHVMAPIEAGASPSGPYLVSTYHAGYRPLSGRRLSARRLWQVAYASALAVAAVHTSGVIHCDVKPANLLMWRDDLRLIDFGIARDVDDQPDEPGVVRCSRGWSAPEQLSAGPLTPAADVFGWGCVLGYLASGVGPFASDTLDGWVLRVRSADADLFGLPAELEELVRLALRREPDRRPSAAYLAAACRRHGTAR